MIQLKSKTKEKKASDHANLTPSPRSGITPPVEYRWKPGQSANPGGRPKILAEESAAYLKEKDAGTGKTNARLMVEEMVETAKNSRKLPQGVSAFKAIREIVEPTDSEEGRSFADSAMARFITTIFHDNLKSANAIEV